MAFVTDSFTDTSGTLLGAHPGETGATWTKHPSYTGECVVTAANRLRPAGNSTLAAFYASGTPATAEYDVTTVVRRRSTAGYAGVAARIDTAANTMYFARYDSSGDWQLYKVVAGVATLLGSYTEALTVDTDYTLLFQVRDAAKKVFINSVERISSADNAITAAGRAGVRTQGTGSETAGFHLDNFDASDPSGATFTGTAAISLPALTASGTGTFTAPVYTGAAAISLPDLAASGTGTFAPPVYTGSAAVALPALTGTGGGTSTAPVYSGNAAVSLAALTGAGSGTFTAPTYTGSAAPVLPALTVAGVGTFVAPTYTGSAAVTLPPLTATGSGTFAAEVYAGTAVLALPALTATGAGTFVAPPYTGTAALTLPALTATGVGTFAVPGRVTLSATVIGGATVGAARVGGTLTITTEED